MKRCLLAVVTIATLAASQQSSSATPAPAVHDAWRGTNAVAITVAGETDPATALILVKASQPATVPPAPVPPGWDVPQGTVFDFYPTPCTAGFRKSQNADLTVTLHSETGTNTVRFSSDDGRTWADQIDLVLPKSAAKVNFWVYGPTVSANTGDVLIKAYDKAKGVLVGGCKATVFALSGLTLSPTCTAYALAPPWYAPAGVAEQRSINMTITGVFKIVPEKADPAHNAWFGSMNIGFLQNVISSDRITVRTPTRVEFVYPATAGTVVSYPTWSQDEVKSTAPALDCAGPTEPLCGSAPDFWDGPYVEDYPLTYPISSGGQTIGYITYSLSTASLNDSFATWMVSKGPFAFGITADWVQTWCEGQWIANVSTAGTPPQQVKTLATAGGVPTLAAAQGWDPTISALAGGPLANSLATTTWKTPTTQDPVLASFTIPAPAELELLENTVTAGGSIDAQVTLTSPAPPGGCSVVFTSDNAGATIPGSVFIPAGALEPEVHFEIITVAGAFNVPTTVTIGCMVQGVVCPPVQATFTVTP